MAVDFEYDRSRAMKAGDFKPCIRCRKGVMHCGIPLYHRITVETFGVDAQAVRQTHGLETMMGNVAIARVMGPDLDIGVPIGAPLSGLLCNRCSSDRDFCVAELNERLEIINMKDIDEPPVEDTEPARIAALPKGAEAGDA